jgi:hypothetical protein
MLSVNQVLVISPEKEHLERIGDDISLSFTSGDCSSRKSEARTNAKDYLPRRFACLAALRCALASFFIDFRCFLMAFGSLFGFDLRSTPIFRASHPLLSVRRHRPSDT